MDNKVLIYSLSWNRLEYTQRCIESVKKNTVWPHTHLVIDQGSSDGSAEWLDKNHYAYLLLSGNIGITQGMNRVHKEYPDYDWYVKLDNDGEILSKNWLSKMMEAQLDPERHREMILSPYVKGLVVNKGGVTRGMPDGHPTRFEKRNISYTTGLGGICMLYSKRIWNDFGGYPKDRPMHYGNDLELTGKWQELNFYNGYIEDIFVAHMDTTLGQQRKYKEYFNHPDHASPVDEKLFKDYESDL